MSCCEELDGCDWIQCLECDITLKEIRRRQEKNLRGSVVSLVQGLERHGGGSGGSLGQGGERHGGCGCFQMGNLSAVGIVRVDIREEVVRGY